MCVCVCVKEGEREGRREVGGESEGGRGSERGRGGGIEKKKEN